MGLLLLLLLYTAATEAVISRVERHDSLHFSKRPSPSGSVLELPESLRQELLLHSRPSPRAFTHHLRARREEEVKCGLPAGTVLEHNPVSLPCWANQSARMKLELPASV